MDTSFQKTLQGDEGRQNLICALRMQSLIHDEDIAIEMAPQIRLQVVGHGAEIIRQGASDTDLFLILKGEFAVVTDGRVVARKSDGDYVGEMAAVDPGSRRSATVVATSDALVARISEPEFTKLANTFPRLWRRIAAELATRLRRRGTPPTNGRIHGQSS
jgi:CRP/FNR family transcriptional regulator, cyclic AMP receptor protein